MYMLKDAIITAGAYDSSSIRAALEKTDGSYVTGDLTFDSRRNPVKSAVIMEIVKKDGVLTPVFNTTVNP